MPRYTTYGQVLENEDLNGGTNVNQPMKKIGNDAILLGAHAAIINFNEATFDYLKLRVFANRNGACGKLLYESTNQRSKIVLSEAFPRPYKVIETFFEFNYNYLKENETYRFVLFSPGYVRDGDNSFLCWQYAYPKPIYRTNNPVTAYSQKRNGLFLSLVTGDV